jgi:hypothetical protein
VLLPVPAAKSALSDLRFFPIVWAGSPGYSARVASLTGLQTLGQFPKLKFPKLKFPKLKFPKLSSPDGYYRLVELQTEQVLFASMSLFFA